MVKRCSVCSSEDYQYLSAKIVKCNKCGHKWVTRKTKRRRPFDASVEHFANLGDGDQR